MKHFFFLSGLPRSGSTLLSSILSQNPEVYASPNSALVELLVNVRNHLRTTEQARAFMQPTQEADVLMGIMEGMYAFTEKTNIIDKSRAWPHPENIKLLKDLLPYNPKFIATVRDLPSILASFIAIIESNPEHVSYIDKELKKKNLQCTNENRCTWLFTSGGTVHESWYSLKMAFDADFSDLFHIVEYDDLIADPEQVLEGIYDFLGLPYFAHDLQHIINETPENDAVYDLPGMHAIRPKLTKASQDPCKVIGRELVKKSAQVEHFWRKGPVPSDAKSLKNPFSLRTV